MAKRRSRLVRQREAKRVQRRASMDRPGRKSKYARKAAYLHKHGLWGWQVPEPKPWKTV